MFINYFRKLLYIVALLGFSSANAGSYEDFFAAVIRDDGGTIRELVSRGFDANARSPEGQTGLFLALQKDSLKAADALLQAEALDVNALNVAGESALMMAALKGRTDWCVRLLDRGARVNQSGWTPLHYAATSDRTEPVALLLDRGASVNAESPNRTTPLMMAARYGNEDSVKLLLARQADGRKTNDHGLTAAQFAKMAGRERLSEWLAEQTR
jgi:ankyrin repeat protein